MKTSILILAVVLTTLGASCMTSRNSVSEHHSFIVIDPEEKIVSLRIIGQSGSKENVEMASFAIEVATKPLINLFWGGAILCIIGAIASFLKRWKQVPLITPEEKLKLKDITKEKVLTT